VSPESFLTGDPARDQRNVDVLLGAVKELCGRTDLDAIIRRTVDGAIEVTGAQRGVLFLADASGALAVRLARHRDRKDLAPDLRYSRGVVGKVWTTGRPYLTTDFDGPQAAADLGQSVLDLRLLSILAVPLVARDRAIGVLYVDSTATAKEFTQGEQSVFAALAGIASVALERARLASEEAERKRLEISVDLERARRAAEEAERRRLQQAVDAARNVQQSLAPGDLAVPSGFEVANYARPLEETSGDYHDLVRLDDGAVALVVGDVSYHGFGSALHMVAARAVLRTRLRRTSDLAPALAALNAFLCADMAADQFMSLFAAVVDPATRQVRWASAGHNPPFLWRPSRSACEELGPTGPVLGVVTGATYRVGGPETLAPGDALFLFTDGLFEAQDEAGSPWGEEALRASVERHAAAVPGAADLLERVLADRDAFVGAASPRDDVTVVVLRGR
jgi:sigma-B regulation protein RsbU (phosphoserine phosphatase)